MNAVIKFRITTELKAEVERVADARGVPVSRLMRRAIQIIKDDGVADYGALSDLKKLRKVTNALIAAFDEGRPEEAADAARETGSIVQRLAGHFLRGAR